VNDITALFVNWFHHRTPPHIPRPDTRLKEQTMSNPYDTGKHKKESVLGPTLKFKGDLTASEDLLIQGKVEGSIKHTSNLTIGEEGNVKANIEAEFICVEGKVSGDLQGSKSVVIKDTANIEGNIYSPTVSLLEGSTFNGKIDMSGKERPQAETPQASQAVQAVSEQAEQKSNAADKKRAANRKRSASAA